MPMGSMKSRLSVFSVQRSKGRFRWYGIGFGIICAIVSFSLFQSIRLLEMRSVIQGYSFLTSDSAPAYVMYITAFMALLAVRMAVRPSFLSFDEFRDNSWYLMTRMGRSPGSLISSKIWSSVFFVLVSYITGHGITSLLVFLIGRNMNTLSVFLLFATGVMAVMFFIFLMLAFQAIFSGRASYYITLVVSAGATARLLYRFGIFGAWKDSEIAGSAEEQISFGPTAFWIWIGCMVVFTVIIFAVAWGKCTKYRRHWKFGNEVSSRKEFDEAERAVYRDRKAEVEAPVQFSAKADEAVSSGEDIIEEQTDLLGREEPSGSEDSPAPAINDEGEYREINEDDQDSSDQIPGQMTFSGKDVGSGESDGSWDPVTGSTGKKKKHTFLVILNVLVIVLFAVTAIAAVCTILYGFDIGTGYFNAALENILGADSASAVELFLSSKVSNFLLGGAALVMFALMLVTRYLLNEARLRDNETD
ncbi:MAG: hypothetical protein ACOX6J_00065 [Oscillospiraceae bacterium]|jgi:hypothetical protein